MFAPFPAAIAAAMVNKESLGPSMCYILGTGVAFARSYELFRPLCCVAVSVGFHAPYKHGARQRQCEQNCVGGMEKFIAIDAVDAGARRNRRRAGHCKFQAA